jgi:hypothetical protein
VEDRPQSSRRNRARGIGEKDKPSEAAASPWPYIAELIDHGEITVGEVRPVGCVAVASDEGQTLAMLQRRPRETFPELLNRLNLAIAKAYTEDIFTDEINPPPPPTKSR